MDTDNYDGPDNMTLSPYGGLILAEDGEGIQHLVGVTDEGKSYPMACNDLNDSEFAGPAFSADGRVLFANIQSPGYVLAITGPWAGRATRRIEQRSELGGERVEHITMALFSRLRAVASSRPAAVTAAGYGSTSAANASRDASEATYKSGPPLPSGFDERYGLDRRPLEAAFELVEELLAPVDVAPPAVR